MPRSCRLSFALSFLLVLPLVAQQDTRSPNYGTVSGRRYLNGYFGFSYRFPEGWTASVAHAAALTGAADRNSTFFSLLTASPAGGSEVRYASIQADRMPDGFRSSHDFADAAVRALTAGHAFQLTRESTVNIAGHPFVREDLRSKAAPGSPAFLETQLITASRGYAITFSFIAANNDDLAELIRSAESLEFFAPGNFPVTAPAPAVQSAQAAPAPAIIAAPVAQPVAQEPEHVSMVVTVSAPVAKPSPAKEAAPKTIAAVAPAPPAMPTTQQVQAAAPQTSNRALTVVPAQVNSLPAPAPLPIAEPVETATAPLPARIPVAEVETQAEPVPQPAVQPSRPEIPAALQQPLYASSFVAPGASPKIKIAPVMIASMAAPPVGTARDPFAGPSAHEDSVAPAPVEAAPVYTEPAVAVVRPAATQPQRKSEPVTAPVPSTPAEVPSRIKISALSFESYIVSRRAIAYPAMARMQRVEGVVVLRIVLNRNGKIAELSAVSGPMLLRQGALDAVRQWTFRPYLVNGQPVEAETQISMAFRLNQ